MPRPDRVVPSVFLSTQAGIGQHGIVGIDIPIPSATDAVLSSLKMECLSVMHATPVP